MFFHDLSRREFYDWESFFGKTTIILKECSTRGLAAFGVCQEILFGFCSSSNRPIDRATRFQHPTQTCAKEPDAKRERIASICRCPVSLKNQSEGVCSASSSLFLALLYPFFVHSLALYLNFAAYLVCKFLLDFQLRFKDVHLLSFGEQLKLEQGVGHVFEGCHEEPICFPPT